MFFFKKVYNVKGIIKFSDLNFYKINVLYMKNQYKIY